MPPKLQNQRYETVQFDAKSDRPGADNSSADSGAERVGGKFKGTYEMIYYTEEDKSILFLGEENTLYYPQPDLTTDPEHPRYPTINAFRAYFQLSDGAGVKAFNLNFGGDEPLSIINSSGMKRPFGPSGQLSIGEADSSWSDLSGRRLTTRPTLRGFYIHQNKKVAIQ